MTGCLRFRENKITCLTVVGSKLFLLGCSELLNLGLDHVLLREQEGSYRTGLLMCLPVTSMLLLTSIL